MACSFDADRSWGPAVSQCRRTFDFTLLFEEIVFQLLPSCLFLIATAIRLSTLFQRPPRTRQGALYTIKLCAVTTFAALQVVTLILICTQSGDDRTSVSVPAASLSVVAAFALILLSQVEHVRSFRPSLLIGIYLCVTLAPRSATARTYWLLNPHGAVASTSLAGVVVQLVLIAVESCNKKKDLGDESRKVLSDEESVGFLSRSFFTWLNKLFLTGYQRTLTASDLEPIDSVLSASKLANDFRHLQKNPTAGRFGLLGMTLRCLGLYAFAPVLPRLCLTGFTFAQPFLTTSLIAYFSGQGSASDNNGYGLIGASFLVYLGIAVSTGWYWHLAYKCVTKIRGGLVGIISEKMMRLRQEKGIESKVLTLMISDVQRIMGALAYGHEFWIAPIETGLATWLLWRQIGPSSLTVLGIALLSTVGSTYIGKNIGTQQQVWLAATEKRISATKKMLSSLKAIKMMGASERVGLVLERLRSLEFAASKSFRTLIVGTLFSSYSTLTLAPVVAFGAYIGAAGATQDFNASRMFASLILINLLASPLIRLLQIIPSFGAAMGCFTRLEKFLERPEGVISREFRADLSTRGSGQFDTETVVPDKLADHGEKRYSEISTDLPIISIRNGDFGWGPEPLLKDISLEIKPGEHVVVTGSVGCGKSLLLQAILEEMEPNAGSVHIRGASIGYCSQNPWLENITARENAFRFATGDELWEQTIIDACALGDFLDSQTPGETIGSGGARISGGEKQRLALARAIASRPTILLLDDVFSAIDRTTKKTIIEHLFGPNGILRKNGTTVIQITQDLSLAREADKVFRIDDNGHLESFKIPGNADTDTDEDKDDVIESTTEKPTVNASSKAKSPSPPEKEKSSVTKMTDRKVYQIYFHSIRRSNMLIFFACAIAFAFTLKFPDVWAKWWSDANPENSTRSVGYWIGLYAFLSFLPLVMVSLWVAHLMLQIVPKSGVGLHIKLLNSVLNAPVAFLSGIDSGSIINRFNQDLMFVDTKLPLDLLNTASSLFTCIAQVILVVVATVYLFAALPVLTLVLFIIQHVYLRTSKQLRQLDLQSKSGLHTKLSESWEGLVTIRAHGWQSTIRREFHEKLDRSQEPLYLLYMVQTWLRLVLNLVVAGLSIAVVGVAVATRTGASGIGVAFLNLVSLGETMTNLITAWTSLETSLGAIARIQAFEEDTPREPEIKEPVDVPDEWPSSGQLTFDSVWASYYPDAEKPAWSLRNITFQINAGERVAVCGRSGAGKSTLLLSLLGLIETPKGTITLDGLDISRIPRSLLRSRLHVISQDAFIQGEAVREALCAEGNVSDEIINEALRDCVLLEKINTSGGLSAKFDDINLSVGETQLFILARTILQARNKQHCVVLFDEATSSIDIATEQKIMNLVKERLRGKTVISILHRLEAAMEYDRILVLENGKVMCFGTPEEVIRDSELFEEFRERRT